MKSFSIFIWKFQLFEFNNLKSTQNHTVQTLNKGVHNLNAGPDFEDNKIIRLYKDAGLKVHSAKSSQSLIHLHQNYCIPRNCLNCSVFNQILKM